MSYGDKVLYCEATPCAASIPDNKFAQMRAGEAGWFFQKDGTSWCPAHTPDWVPAWREAQEKKAKMFKQSVTLRNGGTLTVEAELNGTMRCHYDGPVTKEVALLILKDAQHDLAVILGNGLAK